MLKKIEWSKNFFTGHKEVDLQHQYFVELINRIIWDILELKDNNYHIMLMEELVMYANFHFKSEENILYKLGYPDLTEHKKLHMELIDTLSSKIVFFKEGSNKSLELIDFLIKWFINHTTSVDINSFERYISNNKEK
ncbi:MAG: bacteriohemerythrin [Thermodesulfovibrionales bacterium]|nr:bacteriohemerythrin [Thermodesulfovibrionales bacterium]